MKTFVSTIPFANPNTLPLESLKAAGVEVEINDLGRKITTKELADKISDADCLIAGTEIIDASVFDKAPNLKLIARVGIGLDGVDLIEARKRGIKVTYTPDAPAPAVAELTIGLMLQLARRIGVSNIDLRNGKWIRHFGYRLSEMTIGIIGSGRIGSRVVRRLAAFGSPRILINSLERDDAISPDLKLEWVGKDFLYQNSDIISLHLPLTQLTNNMIAEAELNMMKPNCMIVNTSRGGIVNEKDLYHALKNNVISQAAVDVFLDEPYYGPLTELDNCFLTAHLGSMSYDCRSRMEIEAAQEVVAFCSGMPLLREVPEAEYLLRK